MVSFRSGLGRAKRNGVYKGGYPRLCLRFPHCLPGRPHARPGDFADLRARRDKVDASIFFLQEVTSPAGLWPFDRHW